MASDKPGKSYQMRHLDVTQLPSDPDGGLNTFRRLLCTAINSARGRDTRMKTILHTLKFACAFVERGLGDEKAPAEQPKPAQRRNRRKSKQDNKES